MLEFLATKILLYFVVKNELSMHDYRVENSNVSILGHAQISKERLFYISTGTFLQIMPMN